MARVSQEHLDARRRQILSGAAHCFARNGFHSASMQDVLKEVGLSAGAVYRYFAGKEDLIAAIADEAFGGIRRAFEEAAESTPPPTPDVLLGRVLRGVFEGQMYGLERRACAALVVQVWAETLRNDRLSNTLAEGYAGMRVAWARLVEAYRAAGLMPSGVAGRRRRPDHDRDRPGVHRAGGAVRRGRARSPGERAARADVHGSAKDQLTRRKNLRPNVQYLVAESSSSFNRVLKAG